MREDAKQSTDVRRDDSPPDLPERGPAPNDDATVKGGAVPKSSATPPGVPVPYPN
jgi:hypothetical protein